jgi:FAD/FMN-containing dehydrogenase/uncharacterized membrane protein YhaH (DUF805 family)
MALKEKLPVSYLLFTTKGRINRRTYWIASIFIWSTFYALYNIIEFAFNEMATFWIYPILFWALYATATKRLHDSRKSGGWLLLLLLPVIGPLVLIFFLGFKKGSRISNQFGAVPGSAPDYFVNPDPEHIPHIKTSERIVNDITQLNPVIVAKVVSPETVEDLQNLIKQTDLPICVGGGRFSMGGQTASAQAIHVDMRKLNRIVGFSKESKTIKVEAGIRWCDIQRFIDPHDLSIKIMQTYANFTVGGALSVNCHGRYIGLGPVILSVNSIDVILADGDLIVATPSENKDLFFGCIGGYNALGIIVACELQVTDNIALRRSHLKMRRGEYRKYFKSSIRGNKEVVFHNGDLYPPHFKNIRAVSWTTTKKKPTVKTRLMPLAAAYPIERYFIGAFARSRFGKWRREYVIDPIMFAGKKIHWRNYEAGYDVLELEPKSRKKSTYVLQEYFVGIDRMDDFIAKMAEIFTRYDVNVINVSIRHALTDSGSLMAWAKEEVFAFVVWYRQGTSDIGKNKVGVWTRELIDAVLSLNGTYYLPYQAHATPEQFHKAYPGAKTLFELKKKLDPKFRFRNVLWDTYFKTN